MKEESSRQINTEVTVRKKSHDFLALSREILQLANRGEPRIEALTEISRMLIRFSGCDALELRLTDGELRYRWEAEIEPEENFNFELLPHVDDEKGVHIPCLPYDAGLEQICMNVLTGEFERPSGLFTESGSFWTGDVRKSLGITQDYSSLAVIPFVLDEENRGLLMLKSRKREFFTLQEVEFYEEVAQTVGIATGERRAKAALRERIKELSCLYSIAKLVEEPGISLERILLGITELLPSAMRYPDVASARIILDDREYSSPSEYKETQYRLAADIIIDSQKRGVVEVFYCEKKPVLELELFLAEEQSLLDTVAGYIELIIKRREWEEEKSRLEEQLRHANRLATIGQLGAGVAHELNEPLGAILGFAQLTQKVKNVPKQAGKDIERIEKAALHAREVVRKLLIFARQMPSKRTQVNLNHVIEEGLYFLESRCEKEGIKLMRNLADKLPEITADPSQLNQVLVNLVVNSLQASSARDRITVTTKSDEDSVILIVEDTGSGMSREVRKQIFVPFFTTKEIGHGTGLGLSVVHGIVASHGGTIEVESEVGRGSRFTVKLPVKIPEIRKKNDSA